MWFLVKFFFFLCCSVVITTSLVCLLSCFQMREVFPLPLLSKLLSLPSFFRNKTFLGTTWQKRERFFFLFLSCLIKSNNQHSQKFRSHLCLPVLLLLLPTDIIIKLYNPPSAMGKWIQNFFSPILSCAPCVASVYAIWNP